MTGYSPFYTFLTYLQLGSIILTFVLLIMGIIGGILGIKALLIYIKKNSEPKMDKTPLETVEPGVFSEDVSESVEEVEAEVVYEPETVETIEAEAGEKEE